MSDDKKAEDIARATFGDAGASASSGSYSKTSKATPEELAAAKKAWDEEVAAAVPWPEHPYTEVELKTIARDLLAGTIFTDRHLREHDSDLLGNIFMPLLFMKHEDSVAMAKTAPGLIFEYISKAGSRSINGYPIFFSFATLSQEQTKRVFAYMNAIEAAMAAI